MASSIHLASSAYGSIAHNSRENFSHSVVFTDEKNECWNNTKEAYRIYRKELNIRSKAYKERVGQNLQKKTATKLSAVVNLEQYHTLNDLKPIVKYLEDTLDTKVFQVAIHRDEGKLINKKTGIELYSGKQFFKCPDDDKLYYDKKYTKLINLDDYEIKKNYHAHIEMMGIDSQGKAIRHNRMSKKMLTTLQDFTAKTLGMERTYGKKKRLDTHKFKEVGTEIQKEKEKQFAKQKENKELKLTVKELKAEIEQLRKEMIEINKRLEIEEKEKRFYKKDYDALASLKKALKKDNVQQIYDEFMKLKNNLLQEEEHSELLSSTNKLLEEQIKELEKTINSKEDEYKQEVVIREKNNNSVYSYRKELREIAEKNNLEFEGNDVLKNDDFKIKVFSNKITATGKNTSLRVKVMLDIAEAKGWSLESLRATGTDEFLEEFRIQLNDRIRIRELERENKKLKEELKAKPKEIEKEIIKTIENPLNKRLEIENEELRKQVKELQEHNLEVPKLTKTMIKIKDGLLGTKEVEIYDNNSVEKLYKIAQLMQKSTNSRVSYYERENKKLKEELEEKELKNQKMQINSLESTKKDLGIQIYQKEEKINSRANMSDLEHKYEQLKKRLLEKIEKYDNISPIEKKYIERIINSKKASLEKKIEKLQKEEKELEEKINSHQPMDFIERFEKFEKEIREKEKELEEKNSENLYPKLK